MRGQRGQATVDYLAVVLLVALVFAAAVGVLAVSGLGEQVVAAMKRALCIVTGGPCSVAEEAAQAPCVLSAEERSDGGSVGVSIILIGERDGVLRERRSDGTIALTLFEGDSAGADLRQGWSIEANWGEHGFAAGRELRAAALAERGEGRTWVVADDAGAEEVIARIRLQESRFGDRVAWEAPDPDVTYEEHGGRLELGWSGPRARLDLAAGTVSGERVEHATGRRTVYVRDTREGAGTLSFGDFSGAGEITTRERFGITYDREGRPVDLVVVSSLDVEGTVGLPPELSAIAGLLRIPRDGAKHVETERHLDLTDPPNADAAAAFLAGLGRAGPQIAASVLRERLEERGTMNVRTYTSEESSRGFSAHAKRGPLGGAIAVGAQERSAQLVSAVARRPDGTWGEDPACLVPA
jgi:hypothetical protein